MSHPEDTILSVRLTAPDQVADLNFNTEGYRFLRLVGYRGYGMANGNPTLFFYFTSHNQTCYNGNLGSRIPLIFDANSERNGYIGPYGYPASGDVRWDGSSRMRFKVENFDFSPAQFSAMELFFKVLHPGTRAQPIEMLQLAIRQA